VFYFRRNIFFFAHFIMTRFTKTEDGHYKVAGKKYESLIGSRAQVMHGTSFKTNGGLKKKDLIKTKRGRIVSRRKHFSAKKTNRLVKAGYGTKKGHFGAVKLHGGVLMGRALRGSKSRRRRQRGGHANVNFGLSPSEVHGMVGTTAANPSVNVQFAAGLGN
jgi:hypothetical protein